MKKYAEAVIWALAICFIAYNLSVITGFRPRTLFQKTLKAGDRITGLTQFPSIVAAVQDRCPYCEANASLYKRLSSTTHLIGLIDVKSPTPGALNLPQYLRVPFSDMGIRGTPILAIVNRSGIISNVWLGVLTPAQEEEVLEQYRKETHEKEIARTSCVGDLHRSCFDSSRR